MPPIVPTPAAHISRSTRTRLGLTVACALSVILHATPLSAAQEPVSPERRAILAARDRKAAEAREQGYWIVARGEHLRLIAQQFFHGDRGSQARLRDYLVAHNPHAFVHGDPARLIPGARLELPPDVRSTRAPKTQASTHASPPAVSASMAPAAPAPVAPAAAGATVVPAPEFAPGPPPPPPPAAPAAYVDQLIEGMPAEPEDTAAMERAAMLPGQRFVSVEYRAEGRAPPGGGHALEQGVQLQARRETLDYGDFYFEGAVRDTRLAPGERSVSRNAGGRFTLYQQAFPVVEGWLADNTLGVVRTPPDFLNASYRIFLPTSLMAGASTVVSDGAHTFMGYAGHVGRLEGSAVQTFDPTTGDVAGLGYAQRAGRWTFGGQAIGIRGSAEVPDHAAATLGAEYGAVGAFVHDKAQLVADDRGRFGAWFDGDMTSGRLRQRFGAYQLDPGLAWSEAPMMNDQRGAYWRGDYQMLRYTLSGGADYLQTNLDDDPSRAAIRSATGYGTFSLRIDRNLSVGAGLTYQRLRTRHGDAERGNVLSGNAYAAWTNALGLSRFDFTSYRGTATGSPDNTIDTLAWSQEWPALGPVSLSSTLTRSNEKDLGVRTTRSSVGVSAHGPLFSDTLWDASVVYGRIDGPRGVEDNVNVSASATWPFARHWVALAQVSVNTFEATPAIPGSDVPETQNDKRVLIGVRYEESAGTPYQTLGLRNGPGSGRLSGLVFFDENGDGLRQPTERGAANVTVYLDGRYPVTTDAQGRFGFGMVSPGSHRLRILNEALPLPWSIDDQRPPVADVPLRGEANVEIPLTKIRP
jgi:hypothetical protein